MMGNIGPLARFDENIRNIKNIFFMMGNSKLKMTFMHYLWAVGKQMALSTSFPKMLSGGCWYPCFGSGSQQKSRLRKASTRSMFKPETMTPSTFSSMVILRTYSLHTRFWCRTQRPNCVSSSHVWGTWQ